MKKLIILSTCLGLGTYLMAGHVAMNNKKQIDFKKGRISELQTKLNKKQDEIRKSKDELNKIQEDMNLARSENKEVKPLEEKIKRIELRIKRQEDERAKLIGELVVLQNTIKSLESLKK